MKGGNGMSRLSETLKLYRIKKNMSQQKIADFLGISKSALNMYERGERTPDYEILNNISQKLNINTDYLLGNTKTACCPICGYLYDPIDDYFFTQHSILHEKYVKASMDFGYIDKFHEVMNTQVIALNIFSNNIVDREKLEQILDFQFSLYMWQSQFDYKFTEKYNRANYKWCWKQDYIEKNALPNPRLSIDKCNEIRRLYEVSLLTDDDIKESMYDFYTQNSDTLSDDHLLEYLKRFIALPSEKKQAIYEQIDFQTMRNKE